MHRWMTALQPQYGVTVVQFGESEGVCVAFI